jgi:Protein of unknown function (DUF3224)
MMHVKLVEPAERSTRDMCSAKTILLCPTARIIACSLIVVANAFGQSAAISNSTAPRRDGAINATSAHTNSIQSGGNMSQQASGTFEVKVIPQKPDNKEAESASLGRFSLDKQFHGDLEATSTGEMLGAMTEVEGSAGYVAMERVRGTLRGRAGTFVLQHSGTMTHGTPALTVTVVPDSGTGDLAGISGTMEIKIENGKHFYEFEYQFAQ